LALFEEGTKLIRHCGAALDRAEQQLKLLTVTPDGPAEVPFVGEEA
jgi:exodeoxyribonuclease VII small subunit